MNTNELIYKLLEKSQEAFILGLEVYNKPTIKYRVEGFSFFICNAWELMLKAHLIKENGESAVYYKDTNRTLALDNCLQKVMTNDKDPVRRNLEKLIELRNTSTHFVTEEYEYIYMPLFQSCVVNYINKLLDYFDIDITSRLSANFLTLSIKINDLSEDIIKARYPKEIAEKLIKTMKSVNESIAANTDSKYAIHIQHDYCLVKNPKSTTATFAIAKSADEAVKIIKKETDMQQRCPHTANRCVEIINSWIRRDKLNFINPSATVPEERKHIFNKYMFDLFCKFYQIRDHADMCYRYTRNVSAYNSYSEKALNLIYEEIKKDPENIIQNLKEALKKKS